ncbi:hypothetical protein I6E68_11105 [Salinibacterium sp. NSLL150]|uniref:hypothetical protein n=1 Tax=unclassified Salinibacterium TaxID=2632331 RepID=UPI0018CF5576|nr:MULTISPECIES: hypothetical protein [unclassified Salinibacterium]MBH0102437.1 hypothetical protein [Salinibacterium sp. NSLL150]MBH0105197.1 hypothetical protein [Salinibacterium sp. NSLL16]
MGTTRSDVDVTPESGRPGILDPAGLGPGLTGLGLAFLGAALFLALSIVPITSRRTKLAARNPGGPTFVARADARLADALNRRAKSRAISATDIPSFVIVSANSSGIFYWGRSESTPLAQFEWAEISELSAQHVHMGKDTVGIALTSPVLDGDPLVAIVAPVSESYPLFAYATAARSRSLVAQMIAQNTAREPV